jgi:hypothetical protein
VRRLAVVLWLVLGAAVWNGFFDLYVSRGAREYGQLRVEHEVGRGPEPDMKEVMGRARRDGAVAATLWAVFVVAAGAGTFGMGRKWQKRIP